MNRILETILYLFCVSMIVLVSFHVGTLYAHPVVNVSVPKELIKCTYDDWSFTKELTERFSKSHSYNLSSYNCVNYSKDLEFIGKSLNININYESGYNSAYGHAWNKVCMDVEPQNSRIEDLRSIYTTRY